MCDAVKEMGDHMWLAIHHFIKAGKNRGKLSTSKTWECMVCGATKKYE